MFSKLSKYVKKLYKDPVFKKSVLNFTAFFAVVAVFSSLTANHVITRKPQPILSAEFRTIPANKMDNVGLEQALRSQNPDVQGLIFFKGLNSIVVLGKGLEHDQLVTNADVDEMRQLAIADKLPVYDRKAAAETDLSLLVSGWWWVAAITLFFWLWRLVFFKREKGQVYSRARVALTPLPRTVGKIIKATGLTPSRFYLYLLIGLLAANAAAFGLRLYQNQQMYVLPSEIATAQRVQPWQISRYLETDPQQFQRVSFINELNTAYVVLNYGTTPAPAGANS